MNRKMSNTLSAAELTERTSGGKSCKTWEADWLAYLDCSLNLKLGIHVPIVPLGEPLELPDESVAFHKLPYSAPVSFDIIMFHCKNFYIVLCKVKGIQNIQLGALGIN
jgi:hypothetical protein